MSAPFTTFPISTITTKDWAFGHGCIFLSDYGVVGNGTVDDTVALNAAFASVVGTGITVIWDVGFCRTTDTIVVGSATGGAGAITSFINIVCPRGSNTSGIFYHGPNDGRPALLFAKNKFFMCQGLNVNNQTGSRGSSVGVMLGGSGTGAFGTQTLCATFYNTIIAGWHVGITDGNFGAASEIVWINLALYSNDIGWEANDFNTLDHAFYMLNGSDNGITLSSGASEGWRVYGGSITASSIADFNIESNAECLVSGLRSENSILFCRGNGGSVSLANCQMRDPNPSSNSAIDCITPFNRLSIINCEIHGWVKFKGLPTGSLIMSGNKLRPDPTTKLPFVILDQKSEGHVTLHSNSDHINFPALPVMDFEGLFKTSNDPASNGLLITHVGAPSFLVPDVLFPTPNSTPVPYGTDYLALQNIRQLSEGPSKGWITPFKNTIVTNAVTAAGNAILHFASVPSWVVPGMLLRDVTTSVIPYGAYVLSISATTVVMSASATGGGVGLGDTVEFTSAVGIIVPGQNLRVQGTFATSGTLAYTFKRNVTINTGPGQNPQLTATVGTFLLSDIGKVLYIAGKGNQSWTDWWGYCVAYIDSTHINVAPAAGQQAPNVPAAGGDAVMVIGSDEPDEHYMVAGVVGDAATPETYSVTNVTTTGFTIHSSNASSTATITALIVR